jgi:ubiquinone biosynthesis accessory factor UbiJ
VSIDKSLKESALGGLERTLNHVLHMDTEVNRLLAPLAGKLIELHVRGAGIRFWLEPGTDRIRLLAEAARAPDTVISGTPLGLLRNSLSSDPRKEMFAGDAEISGDAETGRLLKALLDGLDIDWEEQFSHLVGDVAAHQVGNVARDLRSWSSESLDSMERNLGDWLHEESRLLPTRPEVELFLASVDVLRADADRLEQRVSRIAQTLSRGAPDAGDGPRT